MYQDEELLYEVRGPKNITELTAAELEKKLKTCDTIVFSFGALENHGKHLPLGCDTFQGNVLVRRVAQYLEKKGMEAVPGFAFPLGVQTNQFERTENFGNGYISQKTLIRMTEEICVSLSKSGFKRFVFCVSHAENLASMNVAAKDLYEEYGLTAIVCNWIPPMNDEWPKFLKNPEHQGHGGEDEDELHDGGGAEPGEPERPALLVSARKRQALQDGRSGLLRRRGGGLRAHRHGAVPRLCRRPRGCDN